MPRGDVGPIERPTHEESSTSESRSEQHETSERSNEKESPGTLQDRASGRSTAGDLTDKASGGSLSSDSGYHLLDKDLFGNPTTSDRQPHLIETDLSGRSSGRTDEFHLIEPNALRLANPASENALRCSDVPSGYWRFVIGNEDIDIPVAKIAELGIEFFAASALAEAVGLEALALGMTEALEGGTALQAINLASMHAGIEHYVTEPLFQAFHFEPTGTKCTSFNTDTLPPHPLK